MEIVCHGKISRWILVGKRSSSESCEQCDLVTMHERCESSEIRRMDLVKGLTIHTGRS